MSLDRRRLCRLLSAAAPTVHPEHNRKGVVAVALVPLASLPALTTTVSPQPQKPNRPHQSNQSPRSCRCTAGVPAGSDDRPLPSTINSAKVYTQGTIDTNLTKPHPSKAARNPGARPAVPSQPQPAPKKLNPMRSTKLPGKPASFTPHASTRNPATSGHDRTHAEKSAKGLSGHDFSRAEKAATTTRLQPLRSCLPTFFPHSSTQKNPLTKTKKHQKTPSMFVSLKNKTTPCFQQLTRILIEPMFRLELEEKQKTSSRGTALFQKRLRYLSGADPRSGGGAGCKGSIIQREEIDL